jgi:putative ABC transport system permease protein
MFYPLMMTLEKGVGLFALIFGRCVVSGLLAIRKLRDANPADMF